MEKTINEIYARAIAIREELRANGYNVSILDNPEYFDANVKVVVDIVELMGVTVIYN